MTVQIALDDEVVQFLTEDGRPVAEVARERLVLDLFRRFRISRGRASEILGIPLLDFMLLASAAGIPIVDATEEEWKREMAVVDTLVDRVPSSSSSTQVP
jgi:predicted HTH domain antitoxin